MKARYTEMAIFDGYASALGGPTLIAPRPALANASSMERLLEKDYTGVAGENSVKIENGGEFALLFPPTGDLPNW
jgi:hypothetical protein